MTAPLRTLLVLAGVALASCTSSAGRSAAPPAPAAPQALRVAERVADYYRGISEHTAVQPVNDWSWAVYFDGVSRLYDSARRPRDLDALVAWGRRLHWTLTETGNYADAIKAAQVFVQISRYYSGASLRDADRRMRVDLLRISAARYDYADSVFMGLPAHAQWWQRTRDPAFLRKLERIFRFVRDDAANGPRCPDSRPGRGGLFDTREGLWYRDCRFVGRLDQHGRKVMWGRGNGWAIAGVAEVLRDLPKDDATFPLFTAMLREMAERLRREQGADGMWRTNLADAADYPAPETSATALITFALAYGIKAHLLDGAGFTPVVARAWAGLSRLAVQPSGFVSRCQPPGGAPGPVYAAPAPRRPASAATAGTVDIDAPPFCVGAVLLAAAQVAELP